MVVINKKTESRGIKKIPKLIILIKIILSGEVLIQFDYNIHNFHKIPEYFLSYLPNPRLDNIFEVPDTLGQDFI